MAFLAFVLSEILISATTEKAGHTLFDALFVISQGKLVSVQEKKNPFYKMPSLRVMPPGWLLLLLLIRLRKAVIKIKLFLSVKCKRSRMVGWQWLG